MFEYTACCCCVCTPSGEWNRLVEERRLTMPPPLLS